MKKFIIFIFALLIITACSSEEKKMTVATIDTNFGKIELELWSEYAPKAVENFVTHSKNGYYNGVTFHRVVKNFVIQGGDPQGTGMGGQSIWGKVFENEIHPKAKHDAPGILAMANAGPNTNGSQFYITLRPLPNLDGGYTVFGKVINGMDVVNAIGETPVGRMDKPVEDVVMKTITIEERTVEE